MKNEIDILKNYKNFYHLEKFNERELVSKFDYWEIDKEITQEIDNIDHISTENILHEVLKDEKIQNHLFNNVNCIPSNILQERSFFLDYLSKNFDKSPYLLKCFFRKVYIYIYNNSDKISQENLLLEYQNIVNMIKSDNITEKEIIDL